MAETHIPRSPAIGTTSDLARDARARAWAFVYDCHAKKNAAGMTSTNGDDAKKGSLKHEVRANTSIHN